MSQQPVIIHERLAHWYRQLRPRFSGRPIVWTETRSSSSLNRAVQLSNCPILILVLDDRPLHGLEALRSALQIAPRALSLVIDLEGRPEARELAREIGATLVLSGIVVPPTIEALLHRWIPMASQRADAAGWSPPDENEPEPWERSEFLFSTSQSSSL